MTHRPVHSPVPRYARTGCPGRPPVLGWGGRGQCEIEQRRESDSPATQIAAFYPNPGPALSRGFGRTKRRKKWKETPQNQTKTLKTSQPTQRQRLKPHPILTAPPAHPADLLSRRFRAGECYKPVAPVARQVILEPGIGQFCEFESPRVPTRINSWGNFLVHKFTCGKRDSVS